jgi:Mitoguardin
VAEVIANFQSFLHVRFYTLEFSNVDNWASISVGLSYYSIFMASYCFYICCWYFIDFSPFLFILNFLFLDIRTKTVKCASDTEFFAKLHCIRLAFTVSCEFVLLWLQWSRLITLEVCCLHSRYAACSLFIFIYYGCLTAERFIFLVFALNMNEKWMSEIQYLNCECENKQW